MLKKLGVEDRIFRVLEQKKQFLNFQRTVVRRNFKTCSFCSGTLQIRFSVPDFFSRHETVKHT